MNECKHWLRFYRLISNFSSQTRFQNCTVTSKLLLETYCQILDRGYPWSRTSKAKSINHLYWKPLNKTSNSLRAAWLSFLPHSQNEFGAQDAQQLQSHSAWFRLPAYLHFFSHLLTSSRCLIFSFQSIDYFKSKHKNFIIMLEVLSPSFSLTALCPRFLLQATSHSSSLWASQTFL